MKVVSNAQWRSGSDLMLSPPAHKSTAILAIRDETKGTYFILPDIFSFDVGQQNFVSEVHGMPQDQDYWYMLENEILFPFKLLSDFTPGFQFGMASGNSAIRVS